MKNLLTLFLILMFPLFVGLACKNNLLSKFTKQYKCEIAGEPEPKTSEEYSQRGWKHSEMKDLDCTFQACSEALRLDPKNSRALVCRGYVYRERVQNDLALADFDEAIRLEPDNPIPYSNRSIIFNDKGLYDKAIEDLNTVIKLSQNDDYVSHYNYFSRGEIYAKKGDYEMAVKDFTEAIALKPFYSYYYEKRAEAYRALGKNDLAEADKLKAKEFEFYEEDKTPNNQAPSEPSTNSTVSKTISVGVINGKATNLPKPAYPPAARAVKASGAVNVQVTVDEKGNVVSADVISGHPLLRASALQAARGAKFSPTLLSGKPVKVKGILVFNFVPE